MTTARSLLIGVLSFATTAFAILAQHAAAGGATPI